MGRARMNLRRKAFLVLALTATLLLATLEVVARSMVAGSFEKVERDLVMRDLQRAKDALAQEVVDIKATALGWSQWDELWNHMAKPNPRFAQNNIRTDAVRRLNLDLLLLLSTDGRVVHAVRVDAASGNETKVDRLLLRRLTAVGLARNKDDAGFMRSGIICIGDQLLMMTAQPIVRSDGSGDCHGTLLMGRWIDAKEIADIARLTHLTLYGFAYSGKGLPHDPGLLSRLAKGDGMEVSAENDAFCRGFVRIDNLAGNPALLVVSRSHRVVYAQGRKTELWLVAAILVVESRLRARSGSRWSARCYAVWRS